MAENLVKSGRLVTVFGGSGFVGRHVVRALARRGWRVRNACRRPDLAGHLQPLGASGQIHSVQANLRFPASVKAALRNADAVVNLVGILSETGKQSFEALQAQGAGTIAQAAAEAGIAAFVHMSAIGADAASGSAYARSKAAGEQAVLAAVSSAVILRPSIVFGPEDDFFNRFAAMARVSPVLPLIGGGDTKFQPVFVGDVAQAAALALDGEAKAGVVYELGGPEVKSFRELLAYVLEVTGRARVLAPIPFGLGAIIAQATEVADKVSLGLFPRMFVTSRDQVKLLGVDNVVSAAAIAEGRTLQGLGISAEAIETIVPTYLYRFRKAGQFSAQRD